MVRSTTRSSENAALQNICLTRPQSDTNGSTPPLFSRALGAPTTSAFESFAAELAEVVHVAEVPLMDLPAHREPTSSPRSRVIAVAAQGVGDGNGQLRNPHPCADYRRSPVNALYRRCTRGTTQRTASFCRIIPSDQNKSPAREDRCWTFYRSCRLQCHFLRGGLRCCTADFVRVQRSSSGSSRSG